MFLRSSCYTAVTLNGNDYLLPFGQAIVDQDRAYRLSGSGRELWERLADAPSREALLDGLIRDGEISPADRQTVQEETDSWISDLTAKRLLREVPDTDEGTGRRTFQDSAEDFDRFREPSAGILHIAGLTVALEGSPGCFSGDFRAFATKSAGTDRPNLQITVTPAPPRPHPGATVLLENEELCVMDEEETWRILYPSSSVLRMARVSRDGARAVLHIQAPAPGNKKKLQYEVFHACRLFFLIRARRDGCFVLHSASILYRNRAWLFSAPSGTGKSTHTAHWVKRGWAEMLNGDLNLIAPAESGGSSYEVRGIPWCGTSGIATTKTVPLGGIILLRRSPNGEKVTSLPPDDKQLKTMQRLITPSWTQEQLTDCLLFTGALTKAVPVWQLSCTASPSSASVMKAAIDAYLDLKTGHRS
jgi:hypothetical protein